MRKDITVVEGLAEGAFEALQAGNSQLHDHLIIQKAIEISSECDGFVLAQGSMARVEQQIVDKSTLPVFTSLESGVHALADYIQKMEK